MEAAPERHTVNIYRACELAQVTRRTIYNWMAKGRIEWIRTAGGAVRIYKDSLFRPAGTPPKGNP